MDRRRATCRTELILDLVREHMGTISAGYGPTCSSMAFRAPPTQADRSGRGARRLPGSPRRRRRRLRGLRTRCWCKRLSGRRSCPELRGGLQRLLLAAPRDRRVCATGAERHARAPSGRRSRDRSASGSRSTRSRRRRSIDLLRGATRRGIEPHSRRPPRRRDLRRLPGRRDGRVGGCRLVINLRTAYGDGYDGPRWPARSSAGLLAELPRRIAKPESSARATIDTLRRGIHRLPRGSGARRSRDCTASRAASASP